MANGKSTSSKPRKKSSSGASNGSAPKPRTKAKSTSGGSAKAASRSKPTASSRSGASKSRTTAGKSRATASKASSGKASASKRSSSQRSSSNSASSNPASQAVGAVKQVAGKAKGPAVAVGAAAAGVAGGLLLKGRGRRKKVLGVPLPRSLAKPSLDPKSIAKAVGEASQSFAKTSKTVSKDLERAGDQAERIGRMLK